MRESNLRYFVQPQGCGLLRTLEGLGRAFRPPTRATGADTATAVAYMVVRRWVWMEGKRSVKSALQSFRANQYSKIRPLSLADQEHDLAIIDATRSFSAPRIGGQDRISTFFGTWLFFLVRLYYLPFNQRLR